MKTVFEALVKKWRTDPHVSDQRGAYDQCANDLEIMLEGFPGEYHAPHEITDTQHFDLKQTGHIVAEFFYPSFGEPEQPKVTVGLCHVRAADSITIHFDGERNGYVITMDKTKDMGGHSEVIESDSEVAFIDAWNEVDE